MVLPDYKKSIVNLMSSIQNTFNIKSEYSELTKLSSEELKKSKNVILIVIDGLGYNYVKNSDENVLKNELKDKITTVLPSTTAAAVTTFLTGTAPQQHEITGWFMNLKEIGMSTTILPFIPMIGGAGLEKTGVEIKKIIKQKSMFEKIKNTHLINSKKIINSEYSELLTKNAKKYSYTSLNNFFSQINKAINSNNKRKYVYAYWSELDTLSHEYGYKSKEVSNHFKELNKGFEKLFTKIKNTNTTIIITADHGHSQTSDEKTIKLEDHPLLEECLTMPLTGEPRFAYAYVRPSKTKQFEKYLKKNLKKQCSFIKSQKAIQKNYFGLGTHTSTFEKRIGDYIIIMKEDYVIRDKTINRGYSTDIGNHGGVSENEMYVPLIVFKTK